MLDSLATGNMNSSSPALNSHDIGYRNFFWTVEPGSGVNVVTRDGSVHFLRTDNLTADDLRKSLQVGGCTKGMFVCHKHLNWPNIAALAVWLLSVGTLLTITVRSRRTLPTSPAS